MQRFCSPGQLLSINALEHTCQHSCSILLSALSKGKLQFLIGQSYGSNVVDAFARSFEHAGGELRCIILLDSRCLERRLSGLKDLECGKQNLCSVHFRVPVLQLQVFVPLAKPSDSSCTSLVRSFHELVDCCPEAAIRSSEVLQAHLRNAEHNLLPVTHPYDICERIQATHRCSGRKSRKKLCRKFDSTAVIPHNPGNSYEIFQDIGRECM
ncbi:unnamed protein product [Durusdinium trenchii]|uniref:Uncharacterized protein n=1 Tax=Durusdinium trenchii TaxID=1381693 RepID=A0ABP0N8H3_9DINO